MSELDHEIEVVAREIAAYLKIMEKPADTLEGITQWWLESNHHIRQGIVERALVQLIEKGVVESKQLPDGTIIYVKKIF